MMRYERLIRGVSVRTRLLAALLFVSIVPAVFIGVYAYHAYTRSITEKLTDSAVQTIRQLNVALTLELERYKNLIDDVSVSPEVQEMLFTKNGGYPLRREIDRIVTDKSGYLRSFRVVDSGGDTLYDTGYARISPGGFSPLLHLADASSPKDSLYHLSGHPVGILAIGRRVHLFPLGQEHIGYIFAFVDDYLLNQKILNDSSFGGGVALLSADGTAISGNMTSPGTQLSDTSLYAGLIEASRAGSDSFTADVGGTPSLVVYSRNDQYDAYLVAAIPLSYIHDEAAHTGQRIVLLVVVAAALSAAISMLIYRSIAAPIKKIVSKCHTGGGSINDKSPDEIGFLARAIDQYAADLDALTQMRVADQRRKRELELAALQYQINPHFLFNTLGTLKWAAVINDAPPVISEGITSLSQLLQTVLLKSDEMIPLREELHNLAHYLIIQKIRYADCFKVVNEIDETVMDSMIPRFILQPLVENAVLHGSEGGERQIVITVRCRRVPKGVLLEIEDDGGGFDPARVKNAPDGRFSGIGLSNVDDRLKLYFGEESKLEISSGQGKGTVCRVVIPEK
ncbi:MAG: histidine kinase [Oscillospiraceae bacterium]|nr:histidine kinase [Oscillospiraceae bacterium]